MAKGLGDVWLANVQLYTNQRKKHPTKCPVFTVEFFLRDIFVHTHYMFHFCLPLASAKLCIQVKSSLINDTYTRTAAKEL